MGEKNCSYICAEIGDLIPAIVKLIKEQYHITEIEALKAYISRK